MSGKSVTYWEVINKNLKRLSHVRSIAVASDLFVHAVFICQNVPLSKILQLRRCILNKYRDIMHGYAISVIE